MTAKKIYISGMGILCSLGNSVADVKYAIQHNQNGIAPLSLFEPPGEAPLPVGQINKFLTQGRDKEQIPRTHLLAGEAAGQAMAGQHIPPDAIVLGTTTGGMFSSESHLEKKERDPEQYSYHVIGSVAEEIAKAYACKGPVITVSTACSSGTAAIIIAMEMLRQGKASRVLTGGVDSICRLTYYGFKSLQLIDPEGARPFDKDRKGMNVADGAAMFLLTSERPDAPIAEILGGALSCDAYHPTAPHPQGKGAFHAMDSALKDAGISREDIGYINLHGTGTYDNDLSEARAVKTLFQDNPPRMSSVKGATGHSLAASGAVEAVISTFPITDHLVPANTCLQNLDPELLLDPVRRPEEVSVSAVLSNSFGFGGNNASVVVAKPDVFEKKSEKTVPRYFSILGCACLTGAGDTEKTLCRLSHGKACKGMLPENEVSEKLSSKTVRRLKRLPRMALSLATAAADAAGNTSTPSAVFFGTGLGALSETNDFLSRLFESKGQFTSPTSFIGSVHNSPASHIAQAFQSTGANVTTSGSDHSFEQALMSAELLAGDIDDTFLVAGADEAHPFLSPLFDPSVKEEAGLSDGGGAFVLMKNETNAGLTIQPAFYENNETNPDIMTSLVESLGGQSEIDRRFGVLLAGMPRAAREKSKKQLASFLSLTEFRGQVVDYRKLTGEFFSASAVAAVIAAKWVEDGYVPGTIPNLQFNGGVFQAGASSTSPVSLSGKGILIISFGNFITAMVVTAPS